MKYQVKLYDSNKKFFCYKIFNTEEKADSYIYDVLKAVPNATATIERIMNG